MDPATATITAAGIAAGAAVFVSAVSIIANALTTRLTVRANRAALQDQRLWEKRSAIYEELIRHVNELKDKDTFGTESAFGARVATYATDDVRSAFRSASLAAIDTAIFRDLHQAEVQTMHAAPTPAASEQAAVKVGRYAAQLAKREDEAAHAAKAMTDIIRAEVAYAPLPIRRRWAWSRWPWARKWARASRD